MAWRPMFKKGQFVDILQDDKWISGFVINLKDGGYREYNVQLLTNGNIVSGTARIMRSSNLDLGDDDFQDIPLAMAPVKPKRFADTKDQALQQMELGAKAKNTHRQTSWGVKMFKDWLVDVGEDLEFEMKDKSYFCQLLKRFYANVRTQDGHEYSHKSLMCVRASLQRYLNEPSFNVGYSIIGDPAFLSANNVLKGHIKKNKESGLDVSSHYDAITPADQELLYSSRVLSHDSPKTLQNKVFYELSLHFGRRAREGLHALEKDHIIFKNDEDGIEYATLTYNPMEKNHQGLSQGRSEHSQCMYGTGLADCPLATLKLYLSLLSPENKAFYQSPKHKGFKDSPCWYTKSSVGINTLGKMMVNISKQAKLSKSYTNHCICATCVTNLRKEGISSRDIKSVTGHKSEQSIDFYSKTPDNLRKVMSNTLACRVKPTSTVTSASSDNPMPSTSTDVPHMIQSSQTSSDIRVNKVVNVNHHPQATTLFSHVNFKDCTVTINYK